MRGVRKHRGKYTKSFSNSVYPRSLTKAQLRFERSFDVLVSKESLETRSHLRSDRSETPLESEELSAVLPLLSISSLFFSAIRARKEAINERRFCLLFAILNRESITTVTPIRDIAVLMRLTRFLTRNSSFLEAREPSSSSS